jgi:hypothetical protein
VKVEGRGWMVGEGRRGKEARVRVMVNVRVYLGL